ncbi:hypothetical protein D3C73_786330 [compost metagenome]
MQRRRSLVRYRLPGSQIDHLRLFELAVVVIEHRHLRAHFHGQPGVFAVGAEQQMSGSATGRQLYECRGCRGQRQFRVGLGIEAVGEHLVGTQVVGEHVSAVRRRDRRMHMGRGLALGIDPARRVAAHLHHRFELAIGRRRQYRQGAARVFGHRVIADKQMAAIDAEAGMGRLVAQALHLADQAQRVGLGINRETADAPYRIGLARAVFVDHEQVSLILRQGQPRRVRALDHLQGAGIDLPGAAVERQAVDALALTGGVGAHQQLIVLGGCDLDAHGADAAGHQQWPEVTHRLGRLLRCHR